MRKNTILLLISFLFCLSYTHISYALSVETHRAINEYVSSNALNGFSLSDYLNKNLGFSKGKEEEINGQKIYKWFSDGGEYEDWPPWSILYIRSLNHFHNPITEKGFKGDCLGSSLCVSSTKWALMPLGTQSILTGNYSWLDVRDYYYKALTSSTKTERDTNFAETFRGLGQLMHLIQDASVPAHTRNDFHFFPNYENWVEGEIGITRISNYNLTFFGGNISAITSFIDTNQYNGTNPSTSTAIGLSEYTNANFFSEDTIFSANYPNPAKENTNAILKEQIAEDGQTDKVYYIQLNGQNYRLAAYSYFKNADINNLITTEGWKYNLDDHVYSDYASLLLPRAVGYSAGLLNYFFRGNMDFTIDANDREDGTKGVKISNRSNEDMDGTFSLYYDTADTNRHLLGSWNLTLSSQSSTQVLNFSLPQDYNKYKYTLAFRGKIGAEQDSVAGYQYAGWREEWDNGLKGNHTWFHSGIDFMWPGGPNGELIDWQNPLNGQTINEVRDGKLLKENIRYADTGNRLSKEPRINQTLIRDAYYKPTYAKPYCLTDIYDDGRYCFSYDFGEEFPMPVTKDAWISVKIDEISINEPIPYRECGVSYFSGSEGAYQGIFVEFDNGNIWLFTVPGHERIIRSDISKTFWVFYVELGKEWSYNIFATFKNGGVEFTEPVNIKSIEIIQQLWYLCEPSPIEHRQRMVVDYIRIEER